MDVVFAYRGRRVTESDLGQIRDLIAANPQASRRALSKQLCETWQWQQPNGTPRDMVCRGLMLGLHRKGLIELPPLRRRPPNPLARRIRPHAASIERTPVRCGLAQLGALEFVQVRRTDRESLFNALIEEHHYLGYTQPVGEHLKYLVYAGERPLALFAWSSAPRHLEPRDRFIGWSMTARRDNIRFVAYNPRFLILPWVEVRHLASHLLGAMMRRLSADWQRLYGHPIYFAETFVDPERFAGTCYRAANWMWLGRTTGRGKDDQTHRANRSLKDVLGYALHPRFRELLAQLR
jgi:Druantia protein DruA